MFMIPAIAVLIAALLLLPMVKNTGHMHVKKRLLANSAVFATAALMMVTMTALGVAAQTPAAEPVQVAYADNYAGAPSETAAPAAPTADGSLGMGYLAAALATGLSCIGAGIAIASTAPAAIGAFSEDPKAFGKALIFVVLGEGVALYGLLVSILLINKL